VPTWMPTTALVTGGPYRISRNPIYLALTLVYLGLALAWGSLWPVVLLAPLLIVMRYGVIGREERYLEARFGDAYRAYRAAVRRWI
jgi:protein-S-isoprenylcysteine O-methyltransferase Ste14